MAAIISETSKSLMTAIDPYCGAGARLRPSLKIVDADGREDE